ncbi:hypothetical protein OBBRIDRAFT_794149 [Obba rivulosa]|uniref:ZZ-type domain-containing protein n=1 Tax=Obba rivulosa TaxID=1052685 RepID=A0A8E2ARF0_9APHY|nr:hypothetical protein OBBRIDRAFT_794149 [Obba rivulosa]
MSFTVKATYGYETRKFVFDHPSFPSYEQLYNQLYKIFPSSNSYYLSRLLFSPSSSYERILIGMEAHSAEEYNTHIAPYQGRQWPGALLRVTVYDETPHKLARRSDVSNRASMAFSVDSELSGATTSTTATAGGASSDTAVEGNAPPNSDDLSEFLDRLLEPVSRAQTSSTRSLNPFLRRSEPTDDPAGSASVASASRDVASASRPLPETPITERRSSTSSVSTATARPSLFDLLSERPELGGTRRLAPPPSHERPTQRRRDVADNFTKTMSMMEELRRWDLSDKRHRRASAYSPSARDVEAVSRLHRLSSNSYETRDGVVGASQEARPPVLPRSSHYRLPSLHPRARTVSPDDLTDAVRPRSRETSIARHRDDTKPLAITVTRSQQISEEPVQETPAPAPDVNQPETTLPDQFSQPESTQVTQARPNQYCCSVARGKAEVQAMLAKFMADFEESMKRAFGDDWATVGGCPHADSLRNTRQAMEKQLTDMTSKIPSTSTTSATQAEHVDAAAQQLASMDENPCTRPPLHEHRSMPSSGLYGHGKRGARTPPRHPESYTAWLRDRLSRDGRISGSLPRDGPAPVEPAAPRLSPLSFIPTPPPPPHIPPQSYVTAACSIPPAFAPLRPPPPPPPPCFLPYQPPEVRPTCWAGWAATPPPPVLSYPPPPPMFVPIRETNSEQEMAVDPLVPAETSITAARKVVHTGVHCDVCKKSSFIGVRFKCLDCQDYDLCGDCMSTPSARELHSLNHEFFPIDKPYDLVAYHRAQSLRLPMTPIHGGVTCDACGKNGLVGVRHKCLVCEDFDLCSQCISSPSARVNHSASHPLFPIESPGDLRFYVQARDEHLCSIAPPVVDVPSQVPTPPVHRNILCDVCDSEIVGIRHKCLDCPDFDMCSKCVAQPGARAAHGSHHQFFEIERPGDLYVHTVFSGDGERAPNVPLPQIRSPRESGMVPAPERIAQGATCNMCDSYIFGDRYKCLNCPDYDTCSSCFGITPEQHPGHGFVKINTPKDLQMRNALRHNVVHYATCDICHVRISGTRYKCMHKSCPDFDLCQNCEALPVPVHPPSHPLLKLKTADAAIPAVHGPQRSIPAQASDFLEQSTSQHDHEAASANIVAPTIPADLPPILIHPPLGITVAVPAQPTHVEALEQHAEQPFEAKLVDIEESPLVQNEPYDATTTFDGLTTPSEAPTSTVSSVPRLGPVNNDWHEFWPEMTSVLKHLLQPTSPDVAGGSPSAAEESMIPGAMPEVQERSEIRPSTLFQGFPQPVPQESPLIGEALLFRPSEVEPNSRAAAVEVTTIEEVGRLLNELTIRSTPALKEHVLSTPPKATESPEPKVAVPLNIPLTATFLSDNNIPDGQVFPPGAEFVKSWRMLNDGVRDWPEATELVFVAGDRMPAGENAQRKMKVGVVKADMEAEIAAGEMKAPEIPGRYISYWRLSDGDGNLFGHSIWVDITVAEMQSHAENSSADESLASSSIIMPSSAPERSSAASMSIRHVPHTSSTLSCAIPSAPASEDGSFGSAPSLVDLEVSSPTLSDDDDDAVYEDSRSQVLVSPPRHARDAEYVMLYETSSEDE